MLMNNKSNHIFSIISMALTLFLIGIVTLLSWSGNDFLKSIVHGNIMVLTLPENADDGLVKQIKDILKKHDLVQENTIKFISKDEGAVIIEKELGKEAANFDIVTAINPLIQFYYDSDVNQNRINALIDELNSNQLIEGFEEQPTFSNRIRNNIYLIISIGLALCIVSLITGLVVMANTIKISIFSSRILIKQMELIGASWQFISKPFLIRAVLNGFWSSLISLCLIGIIIFLFQEWSHNFIFDQIFFKYVTVCGIIFIIGFILPTFVTNITVKNYLKTHLSDLY